MGGRRRKIFMAAVLITLGYYSLVNDYSIEPVTKTTIQDSQSIEIPPPRRPTDQIVTLDDIFISVRTSKHYQYTRLPIILETWFLLAKQQTWFFTDTDNRQQQNQTDGHMVNTNCSSFHQRKDLCCKLSVEYDHFLDSGLKWFCHFDDDNYVNVPQLVSMLQKYNHKDDWYLGRTSYDEPFKFYKSDKVFFSFWFATGGAGYCVSSGLALNMLPVASGSRFLSICEEIRIEDDVVMGFIIEHLMKKNLTVVPEFHSHLEQLKLLDPDTFRDQISFGYKKGKDEWNVVNVPAGFDARSDPTRFFSLHCFLFPHFKFCPRDD